MQLESFSDIGGEAVELVQDILAPVTSVYNTLSDVVKKERYDELPDSGKVGLGQQGDDRFQAQVQFQSAKVFLEMEEWENAAQALQDACNIDPDNGHYLADLAWSIYRNPKNSASRAMQEKARQLLGKALNLEKSAEGFAYRGVDASRCRPGNAGRVGVQQGTSDQFTPTARPAGREDDPGQTVAGEKGLFRKMFL